MSDEHMVQLNYVIPEELGGLLSKYCDQNLASPSALVRMLVSEYIDGSRTIVSIDHPRGRRTTVALPERLLTAFERCVVDRRHKTKAAVIAALLSEFLPHRVHSGETVRVTLDIPTNIFEKLYEFYGSGPLDVVITKALESFAERVELSKETS